MENILSSSGSIINDSNKYVLDKKIWIKYDMISTKENVISFLLTYKEAKARCIKAAVSSLGGLTTNFDPNKVILGFISKKGGFAVSTEKRIDAENFVAVTKPILDEMYVTFTVEEKKYYDWCLATNNSEDSFRRNVLNGISKNGLLPIKNSCILKVAFAFELDVLKEEYLEGGDNID